MGSGKALWYDLIYILNCLTYVWMYVCPNFCSTKFCFYFCFLENIKLGEKERYQSVFRTYFLAGNTVSHSNTSQTRFTRVWKLKLECKLFERTRMKAAGDVTHENVTKRLWSLRAPWVWQAVARAVARDSDADLWWVFWCFHGLKFAEICE